MAEKTSVKPSNSQAPCSAYYFGVEFYCSNCGAIAIADIKELDAGRTTCQNCKPNDD